MATELKIAVSIALYSHVARCMSLRCDVAPSPAPASEALGLAYRPVPSAKAATRRIMTTQGCMGCGLQACPEWLPHLQVWLPGRLACMELRYRVNPPDPESHRPKIGTVVACLNGEDVATLFFGIGPGDNVIRTTSYDVDLEHRLKGIATGLLMALLDAYPGLEIVEGGASNSADGTGFMSALRSQGVPYHESDCFTSGQDCICPLGGRQRSQSGEV